LVAFKIIYKSLKVVLPNSLPKLLRYVTDYGR
jgi:hypothetical protein